MPNATPPPHHAPQVRARGLATVLVVVVLLFCLGPARAATTGQLQRSIHAKQGAVSSLAGQVGVANRRVHALDQSVAALTGQVTRLQTDLNTKRLALLRLRSQLAVAHTRLTRLQAAQTQAESVLAHQLIGSYEADRPDLISVVLEATGFNNLLERLDFVQRIRNQDTRVTSRVKALRRAVAQQAIRLGALTVRQQRLTSDVLHERNQVDAARLIIVRRQIAAIGVRDRTAGQLQAAQGSVLALHRQLTHLIAVQAAAAARARALQQTPTSSPGSSGSTGSSGSPAGPITPSSSGNFTFPLPRAAASPPGTWSLDDGVDISAPGNTPLLAVCSGTVVLHGIGGFGPSAPVIHCDHALAGYSYVYYGHAGPGNWTPVGTHVSQGQVVSEVGAGIVGISTGPHLEMGFASSAGGPIGPSSAPAMAALLHAAYGG